MSIEATQNFASNSVYGSLPGRSGAFVVKVCCFVTTNSCVAKAVFNKATR